MLTTTLAEIRSYGLCSSSFDKIRKHMGVAADEAKTHSEPFPVALLIETNGLTDCLWVLAHTNRQMLDMFNRWVLVEAEHSVLATLQSLKVNFPRQIAAVERVAALLRRKIAGEDVRDELKVAVAAGRAAAYAAASAPHAAALSAARAAFAAAFAAAASASAAFAAAIAAGRAASAAGRAALSEFTTYLRDILNGEGL